MPSFASPHPRYQQSVLASLQEMLDAGEETHTAQDLADPAAFAAFTQRLRDLSPARDGAPRGQGRGDDAVVGGRR